MSGGEAQATSRSAQDRRYWLSMAAVAGLTLLVAGLAGGTVTLLTSDPGTASAWGAATVALIVLAGWRVGYRLRERKKLGLPLWRTLSEDDAETLAQYRRWGRSGTISTPSEQEVADAARGPVARPRTRGSGTRTVSRRDRARAKQVRQARAVRAQRSRQGGQDSGEGGSDGGGHPDTTTTGPH